MLEQPIGLDEAAKALSLAPSTLRKRAAAGLIPGSKIGGRWQFSHLDVAKYLDSFRNAAPHIPLAARLEMRIAKYIYVIPCEDLLKIGVARDVKDRWRALATSNPLIGEPLYVSKTLDGAITIEREIHAELRKYRVRGEWFRCDPQIALDAVRRHEVEAS